jgi:hypothetical protein
VNKTWREDVEDNVEGMPSVENCDIIAVHTIAQGIDS